MNLTFFAGGRRRKLTRRIANGPFHVRFEHEGTPHLRSLGTTNVALAKQKGKQIIEAAIDGDKETLQRSKIKSEYAALRAIGDIYIEKYGTDPRRRKVARGNVGCLDKIVRLGAGTSVEHGRTDALTDEAIRQYEDKELKRVERDGAGNMKMESEISVRTTICSTVTQARAIFKPTTMHWFDGLLLPDLTTFRRQGVTSPDRPKPSPLDYGVIEGMHADAPRLRAEESAIYAAFLLFSQCGLRNVEIEHARRSWLRKREDGTYEIRVEIRPLEGFKPKAKTCGAVPMAAEVYHELMSISAPDPDGFLVPARHRTERHDIVNERICAWASKWIRDRSKVIYELRRYAGSLYYDQVGDIVLVQQFLRHADLATTMKWYWYRLKPLAPLTAPPWLAPKISVAA